MNPEPEWIPLDDTGWKTALVNGFYLLQTDEGAPVTSAGGKPWRFSKLSQVREFVAMSTNPKGV